jgi:hypothetical protein
MNFGIRTRHLNAGQDGLRYWRAVILNDFWHPQFITVYNRFSSNIYNIPQHQQHNQKFNYSANT